MREREIERDKEISREGFRAKPRERDWDIQIKISREREREGEKSRDNHKWRDWE